MGKTVKIAIKCPKCTSRIALPVNEEDVGSKKQGICPNCRHKFLVAIPTSLKSKFESDPTNIGNQEEEPILLLETVGNSNTAPQTFELSSDYYTIGRKNNSGPAARPDVEVVTTDMMMSRKHAAVRKKGRVGFTLADLGSKNGVVLNGNKLEPDEEVYLSDGDTFILGETTFRVSFAEKSPDYDELTK
jgi:pSer/pThr/pTyr-binding forkhead associated (FHA) protein